MRKLFRMQYEPCNGDCYAYDDILPLDGLTPQQLKSVMDKLVECHRPLCGNANLRYGLDLDEQRHVFIGSFWHYGKLELVSADTCLDAIQLLADTILRHFLSDAGKAELARDAGLGHSVCHYGEDQDLRRWMVRSSGLVAPGGEDLFLTQLG